ncbi:MAG TPA: cyclic nucleotide-binding domain-containing protein [Gemmatimonadales bacterium]
MSAGALGKVYADGEVIVRQGETGDCMYTLQEGRLEVVTQQPGRGEVRVGIMEQGAIFGEMAIFEKEVRSATVRALGPARVLTIDKRTFLSRVQEDPSLAFNLVRMMSQRIRKLTAALSETARHDTPAP